MREIERDKRQKDKYIGKERRKRKREKGRKRERKAGGRNREEIKEETEVNAKQKLHWRLVGTYSSL